MILSSTFRRRCTTHSASAKGFSYNGRSAVRQVGDNADFVSKKSCAVANFQPDSESSAGDASRQSERHCLHRLSLPKRLAARNLGRIVKNPTGSFLVTSTANWNLVRLKLNGPLTSYILQSAGTSGSFSYSASFQELSARRQP